MKERKEEDEMREGHREGKEGHLKDKGDTFSRSSSTVWGTGSATPWLPTATPTGALTRWR